MAAVIDSTDDVDYVYSDETHVQVDGRDAADFRKPDWSPERFRSSMYTCHLSMLRRDVITEVGGFRTGFDGSQDHDLILRATEVITARGRRVVHLAQPLYHWRDVFSSVSRVSSTLTNAVARGRQAVQDQCDRLGLDATVVHGLARRHVPAGAQRSTADSGDRRDGDAGRSWHHSGVPVGRGGDDGRAANDPSGHSAGRHLPCVAADGTGRPAGGRCRPPVGAAARTRRSGRSPPRSIEHSTTTRATCWSPSRPAWCRAPT